MDLMDKELTAATWVETGYESIPLMLGGIDARGKSVFIKPNAMMPYREPTDTATITDVRIVQGLVDQVRAAGCRSVLVGDCGFKGQWSKTTSSAGYDNLVGAEVRCLMDTDAADRGEFLHSKPGGYLSLHGAEISKLTLACDAWVSVAKMKVHPLSRVTLTIKNLMGVITKGKGNMHPGWSRTTIHKRLRDLYFLLRDRVHLAVIDGVVGLEYSVTHGVPVKSGVVIWGPDPFEVDVLGCRLMGIPPQGVEYLRLIGETLGRSVAEMYRDVAPAAIYEEALFYQRIRG